MSLHWEKDDARQQRPSPAVDRAANVVCTVLIVLAALYFLGHIVAAWMRGSLGGWR